MLSIGGRLPSKSKKYSAVASPVRVCQQSLLFVVLSFLATGAQSQHIMPLTLAEAERLALDREPGQAALLARADALANQSVAAGELPDPTVRMGIVNYPLESGGFTTEGMTQAQLGYRQAFPPGKARDANKRQFASLALEMQENADGRGRDVLSAVRASWLETYYWQQAHTIVDESRPFFSDLVTVTRSMYSVGRKNQQDLLRAELELSRIDSRLIEINSNHARAIANLFEWVGENAARPVADRLPNWSQMPSLEEIESDLLLHPAVRAAEARVDARQAGIDHAEENMKPGWAVDLGYGHRNGVLPNGSPRSDFVSLSFTMDLPLFRENRQNRKLSSALSERRAANESKQELLRRLGAQLRGEHARWSDLNRRIELHEDQILSLASDNAEAALAAYQSDTGDFADVMRGFIDDLNARVDHIRLQVELAQSYAALANLGGIDQ
jgi:outer membrane protein TolC